ncbi:RND family transporter [Thermodesulfobacteriota bacterium]
MRRFAECIIRRRLLLLGAIGLLSLFFLYECTQITVKTSFSDLLPQKHPFIKVHNKIRNIFGGASQVLIMVQVRTGDIFNTPTLEKVQWITRELEKIPGVDPYKIRSIAVSKMKDFTFTSGTMSITPLMYPDVPATAEQMQQLRDKIYSNSRYYGNYVSFDSKKTLIRVDFFEDDLDYHSVFQELSRIREHTEDANHIINIAGEPMHLGYIYHHTLQVLGVLGITVLGIICMLYLYYKSKRAVFIPVFAAMLSAVWGLGFMSLVGFHLDPLILVLPFLIALMTARHCMQCISRYLEEYAAVKDTHAATVATLEHMFFPGITSIVTDALGIALVSIATIPVLVNIAIACSFWCVATVILSVVMTPLILSLLPESPRMLAYIENRLGTKSNDYCDKLLTMIGRWIPGRGKWYVAGITALVVIVGLNYAGNIKVGDFMPGSSVLWPFHRYNKDAFRITFSIPLLNPLYVIVEGDEGGFISSGATLREMHRFQRYMQEHERVMFTYSITNPLPGFLMASYEDDPQWFHLPKEDRVLSFSARKLLYAGEPGTWDQYVDMQDRYANIVIYCRDKMPQTVESIKAYIQEYLRETPGPPGGRYLLAGGAVGVQAAVRDVIADAQIWNLIFALGGIFFFCALNFRSLTAGFILTVPLAISNILTFALMGAYHIGLTVNTYPVASVGIGLGVDYGIYFVSRLIEERKRGLDLNEAIYSTLSTNGRAIIQIATTLTLGLALWVFSSLKFQAEMGALLAILLFLNMLGALFLVPTLIAIIRR